MVKRLIFPLLLLLCCNLYAQRHGLYQLPVTYNEDPYDELTYYYAGASYLTNNVYMGRKDTSRLPYLSAYAGYQLAMGLYIKATANYGLTRKSGHFDLFAFEAGYDRNFGKHIIAGASVEKYLYQRNSPGIKAAITESIFLYGRYENDKIEPEVDLTINRGANTDIIWTVSLDRKIRLLENTVNIFPALAFSYGSMQYYSGYFTRKLKNVNVPATNEPVIKDASTPRPLAVEISARTTWRINNWLFTFSPVYAVPLSPATIKLAGNVATEKLKSSLFAELDIRFRYENK
jgi:hypothetical protein